MNKMITIINNNKVKPPIAKCNGVTGSESINPHTIKAQDLTIAKIIPAQPGLSMVFKLKG